MAVERDGEVVSESDLARSWAKRRRWSTTWWSWALSPGGCMTGARLVATLATTLGIDQQRIVAT
jgi:hypothetical protein